MKRLSFILCLLFASARWLMAVPPGAAALGYTSNLFSQVPTSANIAPATNTPGYNWYPGLNNFFEQTGPLASTNFTTVGGNLVLNYTGTQLDLSSTPLDFSATTTPLAPGINGFYAECSFVLSGTGNLDHWASFWLLPKELPTTNATYPPYPTNIWNHMELDVDETGFNGGKFTGTVHNWTHVHTNATTAYPIPLSNPNTAPSGAVDYTQWHTVGAAYDPLHQTVNWWLDGTNVQTAYYPYVPWYAPMQHFFMIISANSHGLGQPFAMTVSNVALWVPPTTNALFSSLTNNNYFIDPTNGNNSYNGLTPRFASGSSGALQNFANFRAGQGLTLNPGDRVFSLPGLIDHSSDSISTTLNLSASGSNGAPIIFTNYPSAPNFPLTANLIISNSGANNDTIALNGCNWVFIFGVNSTNAYRPPAFANCTNCQVAYCQWGGTNPLGVLNAGAFQPNCQYNWVHHLFTSSMPFNNNCGDGGDHGLTFGTFNSRSDFTAFNIIEHCTNTIGGHDCLSLYGPSNLVQLNWLYSPPSYYFTGCTTPALYWGGRCVEIGGYLGNWNVFRSNDVAYSGYAPDQPGAVTISDGKSNYIGCNRIWGAAGQPLQIYGGKEGGDPCIGNILYGNSCGFNGFETTFTWPGNALINKPYPTYQSIIGSFGGSNACIVNNLFYWNFSPNSYLTGPNPTSVYANNMTTNDPLWANTNNSLTTLTATPSLSPPDFHISKESPAAGAGAWPAHILSASGAGATIQVDNAGYFFAGLTAAGHTIPADHIELQGSGTTVQITAISGNTITVASSLTFTNGQGVALPYLNAAPSVGAYDTNLVTLGLGQSQPISAVLWIGTNHPQSIVSGPGTP